METRKVRLFDIDDPIFRTTSVHLLPETVREHIETRKSIGPEPALLGQKEGRSKKKDS